MWREADAPESCTLRVTPGELSELVRKLDELIRPFITTTRDDAPPGAESVHLGLQAFSRPSVR